MKEKARKYLKIPLQYGVATGENTEEKRLYLLYHSTRLTETESGSGRKA
jgi:hypothetical protein